MAPAEPPKILIIIQEAPPEPNDVHLYGLSL